jgi:hypothetical protein
VFQVTAKMFYNTIYGRTNEDMQDRVRPVQQSKFGSWRSYKDAAFELGPPHYKQHAVRKKSSGAEGSTKCSSSLSRAN